MNRLHLMYAAALAIATPAFAQLPVAPSNLPRVFSVADNFSPITTIRWHMGIASPKQLLPAQGTLPTTANFVHCVYGDTDNFRPQYEYRFSTTGGHSWSKPIALHKLVAKELMVNLHYEDQLVCEGRNVFFTFQSNRINVNAATPAFAIYAYGSNDMGKTWQGPLLMSPAFGGAKPTLTNATPELDAAAAGGRLHVTYEAHRVSNAGGNEECFYSSAEFNAAGKFVLRRADINISQFPTPTTFDVNNPHIAADGKIVAIIWLDNRASGAASGRETFVRVSRDGGDKFDKEVDVSEPNTLPLASSADAAYVAVSADGKGSIYCTYQDMRTGTGGDNLYLMFSKDGGATWVRKDRAGARIMLNENKVDDVDGVLIEADGKAVVIAWYEEIPPVARNVDNQLKVIVDPLGGVSWQVGIPIKPIDLSKGTGVIDVQHLESMKITGRFIAIAHEVNSPETAALSWSCDKGVTWETRIVSDGTKDVDEPDCAVSLNGDINMIYLDDRGGGNSNTTVVTGIKVPTLVNDTTAKQGIKMTCAMGSVGDAAIALFTGTPADMGKNKPLTLNNTGFAINIVADLVHNIGLQTAFAQPAVYIGIVDKKGALAFPGIANFSSLIGVPIYCAVGTVKTNLVFAEFTDPVKLR